MKFCSVELTEMITGGKQQKHDWLYFGSGKSVMSFVGGLKFEGISLFWV